MTREEAIYYLGKVEYMDANEKEAVDMAIESLKAEPVHGDLISRQDTISAVVNTSIPYCTFGRKSREYSALKRDAVYAIKALPSAEKAHGEWILVKGNNDKDYHKCSKCLHTQEITGVKNYCAVCGAKMDKGV